MDRGMEAGDVDPWYEDAMLCISAGYDAAREDEMRSRRG